MGPLVPVTHGRYEKLFFVGVPLNYPTGPQGKLSKLISAISSCSQMLAHLRTVLKGIKASVTALPGQAYLVLIASFVGALVRWYSCWCLHSQMHTDAGILCIKWVDCLVWGRFYVNG